jgi:putative sterol carrier protein
MGATREFFETLDTRRDDPALRNLSGTLRFDLRGDKAVDSWFVKVGDGKVTAKRGKAKADCLATMDSDLFEALVRGEVNAISAALRGDVEIEGQPALLLAFQRLFPGPPSDRRDRAEAGARGG